MWEPSPCASHLMLLPSFPLEVFSLFEVLFFIFFFHFFHMLHPRHMEVSRLGFKSELQLPAYTTATATRDPSRVCDLHHSTWQGQILNTLSEARDQTHNLMDTSWVCYH